MATHTALHSQAIKTNNPDGFEPEEVKDLSGALNALLADVFALYLKTKNFHWHMSGPHFRDYHLLLDEQAEQIFKISDDIAERVRKIGGETIRSIGHIARLQRIADNDREFVSAHDMLAELHADNRALVDNLRSAHELASRFNDYATTSLIEVWIDEAERRAWFLFEALTCMASGDLETGKTVLREYINGTVGFVKLAAALGRSPKSLMRMLSPSGNPQARNLFEMVTYLQRREGAVLEVRARRAAAA
jgi:starvation-inducible DNA-binding protein